VTDRLLVDVSSDGRVSVSIWLTGELPDVAGGPVDLVWPLDADALEELRWYLEDYLRAPYGVYGERGEQVAARLAGWGQAIFEPVFGRAGAARDAYVRIRARGGPVEIVVRSASPQWLGLPWELAFDPARAAPLVLDQVRLSRSVPTAELGSAFNVDGQRLRVLMVISRPDGDRDVGYRMIARPLLERLEAVRGAVELVVLRPPTLDQLREVLAAARAAGEPFQVVHFDGHGVLADRRAGPESRPPVTFADVSPGGVLLFEKATGGPDRVSAETLAQVLVEAQVPVVVLNACQSGAIGQGLEAAVATRLLQRGVACVVAMAYTVYVVAAAEFMAAFYERLFGGDLISEAVGAGRLRLAQRAHRPSPKGPMPLADWMVPVHYVRGEVQFPGLRTERAAGPSLDEILDEIRAQGTDGGALDEDLAAVGRFVGRDGLFASLEIAARLQRVVLLHGPGGVGKTELVKAFGRWWRDTGGVQQPDWVIWHSFEPGVASFGLDDVVNTIGLRVFGANPDFAGLDSTQRLQAVLRVLSTRRLLLILDGFESVCSMPDPAQATPPLNPGEQDQLRRFLHRVAAQSVSTVLITSRTAETWLSDIRRIPVGGLTAEEAVEYADQLLAPYPRAMSRRTTAVFADLMDWLDGHPLSMRMILPHLNTTDPATLLAGLRGTVALPAEADESRVGSLTASLTYSFDHLTAETRRLLVAVSLFIGVVDVNALAVFSQWPQVSRRFSGYTTGQWLHVLDEAAQYGLLVRLDTPIYWLHPALPAYLAHRWRSEDPNDYDQQRAAAWRALLDAYATIGYWLYDTGDARVTLAVIGTQRRTFGALLGYALDHKLWEEAQAIAGPLNKYWDNRGLFEEARHWVDRARIALEGPDGSPPALDTPAGALWRFLVTSQARRATEAHRLDEAEAVHLAIRDMLATQPESPQQRARLSEAYQGLGRVAEERGRLDEAEDLYRRSLAIDEELGDQPGLAGSYHQLGTLALRRGQLEEAEEWYRRSLAIEEELDHRQGLANTYHQLGYVSHARGRLAEAEDWYRRSLAIEEELGHRQGLARSYHQLGWLAREQGRLEDAENWYREALTAKTELGDRPGLSNTYHHLGELAQQQERWDEAENWHREAIAISDELGDRLGVAHGYYRLGMLALELGELEEAEDWHREAFAIRQELGDRPGLAASFYELGTIALEKNDLQQAEDRYRQALTLAEELNDGSGIAACHGQLDLLARRAADRGTLRVAFGGITMGLEPGWADSTHEVDDPNAPFTFAKPDGVGAFQLSTALYRGGVQPMASGSDLARLLDQPGGHVGKAFDRMTEEGPLRLAAASYRQRGDFVRMWYVSDGNNFAYATYVCRWRSRGRPDATQEVDECEAMVRTIDFSAS
jgi:tetratricopeptide (TPR) repeat protein